MNPSKKILVTGGAGYIGSVTVSLLKKRGYEPIIFDNFVYGHRDFAEGITCYEGDIASRDDLNKVLEKESIQAVMHFAAYAYVGESVENPRKYYENNAFGALNLINTLKDFGINKFIFSSTCATYGEPIQIPMNENHPQNPINPYGFTKLFVERVLKDYDTAYGFKSVLLRYFNAAGADPDLRTGEDHNPETHLIPLTLDAAMGRRDEIQIYGTDYPTPDGTCIRDYIHIWDLAEAHLLALEKLASGEGSDEFNLGIGKGFSVREVIGAAEKVTGKKIKSHEVPRRAGDPPRLISDSKKANEKLGWRPKYEDIYSIVESAWAWHQRRFASQ